MTYYLHENVTSAENDQCVFSFRFKEKEAEFFFDVTDEDIISPFTQDNEDIWKADAVEEFLTPDGDLTRYYELEVSPFGVRFWGEILNHDGKTPRLTKLAPPFEAKAVCTAEGYKVQICLPLSALKNFDREKAKLNAFRLDAKADGRQKLYALNPTKCNSFHRPDFFLAVKSLRERD